MSVNGKPPDQEQLAAVYNEVQWKLLDRAAEEIFDGLMTMFGKIQNERKIDVRASMALARAVTAKMYLALDPNEQDMAHRMSQKMIGRLHIMGVRTPLNRNGPV